MIPNAPNMRKFTLIVCLIVLFASLASCSEDDSIDSNDNSIVGTWELTTWTIQIPIDLNNDANSSTNLLDEAECANNETLKFDANGIVSSNMSYNPEVRISLLEGTTNSFVFDVVCDIEGVIGIAGDYTYNNNSVTLFDHTAIVNEDQLTIVYEDAIDIYNEDFTEVVMTKDLTLVYTKK